MTDILAQIDAPHFCAGLILYDDVVTEAAPIIGYMARDRWTRQQSALVCRQERLEDRGGATDRGDGMKTPDERAQRMELARKLTKELADRGMLVESGFAAMQIIMLDGASRDKIDEMKIAYMAGAEHLFMSMMSVMDADREPTDADMARMDMIHNELMRWREILKARIERTGGKA